MIRFFKPKPRFVGSGITRYDFIDPKVAVQLAWKLKGPNPEVHDHAVEKVRKLMPTLARSLDRLAKEEMAQQEELSFNKYQKRAAETAIFPENVSTVYLALGLVNEAGEVAGVVKKHLRDGGSVLELQNKIQAECGDVLWYLAMLLRDVGLDFEKVAHRNLIKLADRQVRGVLGGSGDDR